MRIGEVEAVMTSGYLLWLKASGSETRALFGPALGQLVSSHRPERESLSLLGPANIAQPCPRGDA